MVMGHKRPSRPTTATERLTHLGPNTYNTRRHSSSGFVSRPSHGVFVPTLRRNSAPTVGADPRTDPGAHRRASRRNSFLRAQQPLIEMTAGPKEVPAPDSYDATHTQTIATRRNSAGWVSLRPNFCARSQTKLTLIAFAGTFPPPNDSAFASYFPSKWSPRTSFTSFF